jgi:hypothetical protein
VLLGVTRGVRLARVAQVLDDLGLLVDDAVPTMRSWIEDRCQALPAGFRTEVRAWLLVLGRRRTRPTAVGLDDLRLLRARSAASPRLVIQPWATARGHRGRRLRRAGPGARHRLAGTFVALQSLFRFAKRHRLIFADPTRRLHIGHAAPTRRCYR